MWLNDKIAIFAIVIIVYTVGYISGETEERTNCSDYSKGRPIVSVSVSLQSLSDPRTISLIAIDTEDRLDRLRRTFSCSYHKPVTWLTTTNLLPFALKWNYFERRNGTFISEFLFVYRREDTISPINFACQPFNFNDLCERSYVEIVPGKHIPAFRTSSISNYENSNFEDGRVGNLTWTECPLRLYVKVKEVKGQGHLLEYKWEPSFGKKIDAQMAVPTNSSVYFNNLFRTSSQEQNCFKVLDLNETCGNCQTVTTDRLNAVVFYAKTGASKITFKGLFTLPVNGHRNFYMDWQTPRLEMVHLQEIPSILYVNRNYVFGCNVSTFYFSLGIILTTGDRKFHENGTMEKYGEYGNIEARRNFTFERGGVTETINCFAPLISSTHWIYKSRTVFIDYPQPPVFNAYSKNIRIAEERIKDVEDNLSIFCEAFGKPLPIWKWDFPLPDLDSLVIQRDIDIGGNGSRSELIFPRLRTSFKGVYKCIASNFMESVSRSIQIQFIRPSDEIEASMTLKMWIGTTLCVLTIIFLGVIVLLVRQVKSQGLKYQRETYLVKKQFLNGIPRLGKNKDEDPLQIPILSRPYNKAFEVSTAKWTIEGEILGEGEFGLVRKGTVELNSAQQPVAIKMLKPSADLDEFKGFLLEIKVMEYVGSHPNVISLLACSTDNFANRDVLIGVEYCPNGSLKNYLTDRKGIFQKREDPQDRNSAFGSYANFAHSSLTELDLYIWSYQIARGMEFLASRKVLHGDLATRNILLKADKVAKISDFGLSRFLNEQGNYVKRALRVPWKLMPPESLKHRQFSTSSDVWGYGVTLWELFSLAEVPYAGVAYSSKFLKSLENGMRLAKPTRAPQNVYVVMLQCWDPDPLQRPNFTKLKFAFSKILDTLNSPSKTSQILPDNLVFTNGCELRVRSRSPSKSRSPSPYNRRDTTRTNSSMNSYLRNEDPTDHRKNDYLNF